MKRGILIFTLTFINLLTVFGQSTYLDKGNLLLNNGDFDGAEKIFREGIKTDPNDIILQCQLGLTLIQKEKYGDAELILAKVLEKKHLTISGRIGIVE